MGHSHDHGHGGKNTTGNNPDEGNALGNQNFKVDDMGTDSAFKYEQLTQTPTRTVLTKEADGELTPQERKNGLYQRVILVRYNGVIREVLPDEYEQWKDKLAKGIYMPIKFNWALDEQKGGLTESEYNEREMNKVLALVDGPLQQFVKTWFLPQITIRGDKSTTSVQLKTDPVDYISPLRGQ